MNNTQIKNLRNAKVQSAPAHVAIAEALGNAMSFFTRMAATSGQSNFSYAAATEAKEVRYTINEHGKWAQA